MSKFNDLDIETLSGCLMFTHSSLKKQHESLIGGDSLDVLKAEQISRNMQEIRNTLNKVRNWSAQNA